MLSTMSLGPAAAPQVNTPSMSVRVGASLALGTLRKPSVAGWPATDSLGRKGGQHGQGHHHQVVLAVTAPVPPS